MSFRRLMFALLLSGATIATTSVAVCAETLESVDPIMEITSAAVTAEPESEEPLVDAIANEVVVEPTETEVTGVEDMDKGSPDTGAESAVAVAGISMLAASALYLSRKK